MLGQDLCKVFPDSIKWDKEELDITNESLVLEKISQFNPDLVINSAGYTDVDGAETNKEICFKVNADATGFLAKACNKISAKLVHISTDYVFNGKNKYYKENSLKDPLNQYGLSKAKGEKLLIQNHDKFYLVRTAGLFGKNGKNFIDTILRLAKEKDVLEIVNDQFSCLTYTLDLANAIKDLIGKPYGIYHITNSEYCSWFDLAKETLRFKSQNAIINPISYMQLDRPAKRPECAILLNTKLNPLRSWKDALKAYLEEKQNEN